MTDLNIHETKLTVLMTEVFKTICPDENAEMPT